MQNVDPEKVESLSRELADSFDKLSVSCATVTFIPKGMPEEEAERVNAEIRAVIYVKGSYEAVMKCIDNAQRISDKELFKDDLNAVIKH